MDAVKFSISIIAYNNLRLTQRCVESVLRHSHDFELILTDNASKEPVLAYFEDVKRRHPATTIIRNPTNLGFTEPSNEAFRQAQGIYLVLVNNDSYVPAMWLEYLEAPFLRHPYTAALSGPVPCALNQTLHGYRKENGFEFLEGSCLCARMDLLRKHGLFADDLHFAYGEDADLSLRMRELGYTLHYTPFEFHHEVGATSSKIPFVREQERRNHAVMRERWRHYLISRRFDYPVIFRRRAAMGDVLLVTPIIRAWKKYRPLSRVMIETDFPQLFEGNPLVERAAGSIGSTYDELRINLDMAYEDRPGMHIVEAYAQAARLPISGLERSLEIYPPMPASEWAHHQWNGGPAVVAIHADHGGWPGKNWPLDRWATVCEWLLQKGFRVALVGTGKEPLPHSIDMRGKTTPMQLAACLQRCSLFVGHDSAPLHFAQSVGLPTIGLFGVTSPQFILTGDNACGIEGSAPCAGERHRTRGLTFVNCNAECITSITPEQVIETLEKTIYESA